LCYSSHLILFSWSGDLRDLHSFPTRRSSDLLTLGGHTGLLSLADLGTETSKSEVGVDLTVEGTAYLGSRSPFPEGSPWGALTVRSEEHTSELQSPYDLVCRLLLEKKK